MILPFPFRDHNPKPQFTLLSCPCVQGSDKFLKEFLSLFDDETDGETQNQYSTFYTRVVNIKCEYGITDGRRIDILMKLGDYYIAIENKVWAVDQKNRLRDYANYLNMISNGNYLLLNLIISLKQKILRKIQSFFNDFFCEYQL